MNYPLLDIFLTMFWFFMWCMWIFLVVWTLLLIFRNGHMSGWAKAGWVTLVIFVPLVGVLAYLIVHGKQQAEEYSGGYQEEAYQSETSQDYARMKMRGPRGTGE